MAVKNVTFQVTANTTQATQELAKITRALDLIQKKATIKVTADTTQASGRINNVNSAITQLSKRAISLRVDTKGATAEIKKVSDALSKADKKTNITVQAQTSQARQALQSILDLINRLRQRVIITVNTTSLNNAQQQVNNLSQPRRVNFNTNAAQAQAQVGGLGKSINFVSQAVANSSNNFIRLRNVIARTGLALGAVSIGAAVTSLGRAAVSAATDYEVLRVAFTTFIGNVSLAEVKIKQLRQFAAETPFTVDEVFKASRTLLGYGVAAGELIPIIKRLGDVAGGTGAPLERIALVFGQVRAAGRLYGQDLLQLINAGFNPLQEISRTTGKSFGQLKDEMRKGLVTFEDVNQAFITATSEGGKFFNLTNALANTTQGRLARLKEEWNELLRVIGEGLLPTFNVLVSSLRSIVEGLRQLPKVIEENRVLILSLTAATALFVGIRTKANQANILAAVTTAADNVVERIANGLYRIKAVLIANTTRATVGMTVAQRAQTVANNIATVSQNAFNAAVRANPLGIILTLLALATAAWYGYKDAVGAATQDWIDLNDVTSKADAQANKATIERTNAINDEINAIKATKTGTEERQKLIDAFNQKNKPAVKIKDIADEKQFVDSLNSSYAQLNETIKSQETAIALTAGKGELETQKAQQIENVLKESRDLKIEIPIELLTRPTDIEAKLQGAKDLVLNEQKAINDEIKRIQGLSQQEIIAQAEALRAKGVRISQTQTSKEGFTVEADVTALENQAATITQKVIPSIEDLNNTYTDIAGVQIELNPLETVLQYDPTADEKAEEARKERLRKLKEFQDEYASLIDRIRKNNEDLQKQDIEFGFVNAADFEEEIVKLQQLDRINQDTVDREIDREIESVRRKELTEQQKNVLISQLEIIRGQEQEKRAKDLEKRLYEIERDGLVARRKLANELGDLYAGLTIQRLDTEIESLDRLRDEIDNFYLDIFEDNPFSKFRFITGPRIEFGGTEFQFEDAQADLEELKKTINDLNALNITGGLADDDLQETKLSAINEFNEKYKTTIKLTANETDQVEELSKAYDDLKKSAQASFTERKKQNIFQFSRGVQERGQEDPFVRAIEDSQREYFSLLSEQEKQEVKRREDKRNAEIALLDENYALNLKAVNDEKKLKKDALDVELLLIKASSTSQAEKDKKTRLANIQYQIEIGNVEKGYADLNKEIEKNIAVESDKGLKIKKINIESETEIDGVRKTFAQRRAERAKKDTDSIEENNEAQLAVIKEQRDAYAQAFEDITQSFLDFQKVFIDGQIQQTEAAINAQQKRVDAAKEIADKGNVILLKAEEERLDKLNRQRANYVRQQQNLAAVEIAVNSAIAVAKAAGQPGAPFTIVAILAAMAVGFAQARAQANAAATFAKGGYTGDGHQFQEAGTVHKGEFVMNAQKTRQYRPLLEAIHSGRHPELGKSVNDKVFVVNSKSSDERLERIERAIREQQGMQLSIDENGINGIVSRISYKQKRINNRAR